MGDSGVSRSRTAGTAAGGGLTEGVRWLGVTTGVVWTAVVAVSRRAHDVGGSTDGDGRPRRSAVGRPIVPGVCESTAASATPAVGFTLPGHAAGVVSGHRRGGAGKTPDGGTTEGWR